MKSHYRPGWFIVSILIPVTLFGQDASTNAGSPDSKDEVIATSGAAQLFEHMGPYHRDFKTKSPEAQQYLNQGMIWMQAFNPDEAKRSFLKAAELDPDCAMAWWGVAYAEGPNYNDPKPDDNRSRAAWYALQNALARINNASELERDLILALQSRQANPWPKERVELDKAYAEAMAKVWAKYPTNADVAVLYAAAKMQLKPWELYSKDRQPAEGTMEIRAVLEEAMMLDPQHPGAKHFYIHAIEPSEQPDRALKAAHELNDMVPASGHLLHMPSHIYIQTGDWQEAIDQNVKAVESDEHYRALVPEESEQYGYQAHNSHMLAFAAMMIGQEKTAMKYARGMWEIIPEDQMKEKGGNVDYSLMCVYDVQKRFGRWDDILAEPEPEAYLPITRAYWLSDRAIAYAAKKDFHNAELELAKFLTAKGAFPEDSDKDKSFTHRILKVSEHFIQGEIALQQENWDEASWHLNKAAEVEDTLRYSEPPYWLQPVRHTLGAVYMKAGKYKEAEQTYRKDLANWRDNGWSLYGLSQALMAQGKTNEANLELTTFKRVWASADDPLLTTSCKCVKNLDQASSP